MRILDPTSLPPAIVQRIIKGTDSLLIQADDKKIAYFISKTTQQTELHRKNLTESSYLQDGLSANIKTLHIKYGIIKAQTLEFLSAAQVVNWNTVKLIKIQLRMQSEQTSLKQKALIKDLSFVVGV